MSRSPYLFLIRLRGESIMRSPKVVATINYSVQLARMVSDEVQGRGAG